MMLDRASNVQQAFGLKVNLMGFFGRVVGAKFHRNVVKLDIDFPASGYLVDAKKTGSVIAACFAKVLDIVRVSNVAKVFNAVVSRVAVNVVNLMRRPAAIDVQPSKSVTFESLAVNLDYPVARNVKEASNIAHGDSVGRSDLAGKHPGFWVVIKQGFQAVCRKFGVIASLHQVRNAKVFAVAIDKNKFGLGPSAVVVEPSEFADGNGLSKNKEGSCFGLDFLASLPRIRAFFARYKTGENSSFVVKGEVFAQLFCAKIGISHDAPIKRIGQRPRRVDSTSGLRHFITGVA